MKRVAFTADSVDGGKDVNNEVSAPVIESGLLDQCAEDVRPS